MELAFLRQVNWPSTGPLLKYIQYYIEARQKHVDCWEKILWDWILYLPVGYFNLFQFYRLSNCWHCWPWTWVQLFTVMVHYCAKDG